MKPTPRGPLPFDEVVRRHGATVLRVCRAVLGPGPDADDAWSETFLSALRAWPTGTPAGSSAQTSVAVENVEAWLVRIAHRKAIDIVRARSRRPVPAAEPGSAVPTPLTGSADTTADVWDAVAALPERQRLAVAYHWFGGLPHNETAELTDSTPAAVRRAAADGLATLRRTLSAGTAADDRHRPPPAPPRRTGVRS